MPTRATHANIDKIEDTGQIGAFSSIQSHLQKVTRPTMEHSDASNIAGMNRKLPNASDDAVVWD